MEKDNNLKEVMQIAVYWMSKNLAEWSLCIGSKTKEWKMHGAKQDNKEMQLRKWYCSYVGPDSLKTKYLQNT